MHLIMKKPTLVIVAASLVAVITDDLYIWCVRSVHLLSVFIFIIMPCIHIVLTKIFYIWIPITIALCFHPELYHISYSIEILNLKFACFQMDW